MPHKDKCRGEEVKQSKPECLKTQIYGSNTAVPVRTDNQGRLEVLLSAGSTASVTATDLDIRNLNCETDSVSTCGLSVDDTTRTPLKTDVNRVLATLPSASTHSQTGRLYSTFININSADNEIRQILFNNTSDRTMYLDKIIYSSLVEPEDTQLNYIASISVSLIKNVMIIAAGVPITPTNLNTAFPDVSSLTVSLNPNAVSGTTIFTARPPGGYLSFDFDGRIVVPPNTNLIVQFVLINPPTGLSVDFWSTITWYEL